MVSHAVPGNLRAELKATYRRDDWQWPPTRNILDGLKAHAYGRLARLISPERFQGRLAFFELAIARVFRMVAFAFQPCLRYSVSAIVYGVILHYCTLELPDAL